jgi:hypothetical protein
MNIFKICIWALIFYSNVGLAQSDSLRRQDVDSVELRYGVVMCDTLPELADSIFIALKTKKFESILKYVATVDMIKEEFDTLDLEYLERLAGVKGQYMVNKLRKEHFKLIKIGKARHLNIRNMELINHRYRTKIHPEGHEFGEVTYLCKSGRHQFYISFIALKMLNRWFIADQLKIEEIIEPSSGR